MSQLFSGSEKTSMCIPREGTNIANVAECEVTEQRLQVVL